MIASPVSYLNETLDRLASRSAAAVVARARAASAGLNATLLRRLSTIPGAADSLLAEPVFETARAWAPADRTLGALSGGLLHPDLIEALDRAGDFRMARDMTPYVHQLAAWTATLAEGRSCLVTAGTGAGKTECFLIPVLDDLLRHTRRGGGVQAILLYPLNALIESQRERLAAWAEGLGGRVRFALFNGDTPETPRQAGETSTTAEIKSRKEIRERPPEILVTNITMLEYLLLRPADAPILTASQGALRWLVLDEAHTHAGAQAAEMALLLRRVRAAFGVTPGDVRLVATSATIGGEQDARTKLRDFVAALAGQSPERVEVIEGCPVESPLPPPGADRPLDPGGFAELSPPVLWERLAPHPRLQTLRRAAGEKAVGLSHVASMLFDAPERAADAQTVLDAAARAQGPKGPLLPWRAHIFHRALGGVWACIDPGCPDRDPELVPTDAGWGFGAIQFGPRDRCTCGAPTFEVVLCGACGTAHLTARQVAGAEPRLAVPAGGEVDDFALDAEPEDGADPAVETGHAWLAPARGEYGGAWVTVADARIWDNRPSDGARTVRLRIIENAGARGCCVEAEGAVLWPLRYGPAFFMGNGLPLVLEALAPATHGPDRPMAGRRALSFTDSRQGVARLAAKLQQDAERTLTRSFLYHAVQENADVDPTRVAEIEDQLLRLRTIPKTFDDMIRAKEEELAGLLGNAARHVPWRDLKRRFAQQADLRDFAGEVWRPRVTGGEFADDPERLAEVFLFRELFRRPKVQNNPETMGLLRLSFPDLENRARLQRPPRPLVEAGIDAEGWIGLALATVDFVFRNLLAVDLPDPRYVSLVSPRFGVQRGVMAPGTAFSGAAGDSWVRSFPGPVPGARPGPAHRMIYALIGGHWDHAADRDRAAEVLDALWSLVTTTAARDVGRGVWRIDFTKAEVARLDRAFLCPVTRRPFGYAVAGRSPFSLVPGLSLEAIPSMERIALPRLPRANAGGLDETGGRQVARWCETDPQIAPLRRRGLWTDLHDRIAAYSPFLRAQEHSAQIERKVLASYTEAFKDGQINLLNCSTTMEMGVDIPQVRLVVNANVPPSIANYRQRAGRAGRRGEPWAFTLTFARDLPLDRWAVDRPDRFLAHPITAPRVWFESAPLVQRHVNAALLAAFLRGRGGQSIKGSIGAFVGAGESADAAVLTDAPADAFLTALEQELPASPSVAAALAALVLGTVLAGRTPEALATAAALGFEDLLRQWRAEHHQLLDRAAAMNEPAARRALEMRARRMQGEFLIAELARRGFTPSYGFPTDVVSFDYLSGKKGASDTTLAFGDFRGAASRTLDVAIREYAPGAELVIDGLVYRSEGIRPAWGAEADASHLEDLRDLWSCPACGAFGLARLAPGACPRCGVEGLEHQRALIPVGFLSRRAAHTGYEALAQVPYEMPRISAGGAPWIALPDASAWRLRADPEGQVIVTSGAAHGQGYAVCLACGRAEPEMDSDGTAMPPLPEAIRRHKPLMLAKGIPLTSDGFCPGGYTQRERVQRLVRFVHATRTDVFELQLPSGVTSESGLALAAGLREALAERLGIEAREVGIGMGRPGGAGAPLSAFLFDRAAGGAGYVARLSDPEAFEAAIARAAERLACPEGCAQGCAACVLRPDLNLRDVRIDRPGGHLAAEALARALNLPEDLRVFGPETRFLGRSAADWIADEMRAGRLSRLVLFLHGMPEAWDMGGWPGTALLPKLAEAGVETMLVLPSALPHSGMLDLAGRLALARLAGSTLLATLPTLPQEAEWPVLALAEGPGGILAIAASRAEAPPSPDWGGGAMAPALYGPWPEMPRPAPLDPESLVQGALVGARLLWLGAELSGPLKGFGARFWQLVRREAPAVHGVLSATGVDEIAYSDRYLLTPLMLGLLREVVGTAPGAAGARIAITLAPVDRPAAQPYAAHHAFAEDARRRDVLAALLPSSQITLARRKTDLPHHRRLDLRLADGQRVLILLDQGFGGWRTQSVVRYDFHATVAAQGRSIAGMQASVSAEHVRGYPATIEVSR